MKRITVFLLMFILLLVGCGERSSDMFAMPEIPNEQKKLIEIVETLLERGYEYSELRSGINRQPLQLMDLDGDGKNEGIAVLRDSINTYKTFVYIFKSNENGFRLYDIIEGQENNLLAVSYTDVLGKDGYELIVEWEETEKEGHPIKVYNLGKTGTELVLEVSAIDYAINDLDGDGTKEFVAITSQKGNMYADVYSLSETKLKLSDKIPLSKEGEELVRIKTGGVMPGRAGVFVERKAEVGTVTDVIAYDGKEFVNLLPEGALSLSEASCEDVDGDGIIEIPETFMDNLSVGAKNRCYRWREVSSQNLLVPKAFTYHSFAENWYLLMPTSWLGSVYATRTAEQAGVVEIHFSTREVIRDAEEDFFEAPLFSVYVLTGDRRYEQARRTGDFVVSEREDAIFTAEIISESYLGTTIDEAFIKSIFKNRESEWISEILFA